MYSTNDPNGVAGTFTSPLAGVLDEDAFQRVSDQLYKAFFAFAPALAGSAETNAKGVANTQVVDLENKKVDNVVDAELPWHWARFASACAAKSGADAGASPWRSLRGMSTKPASGGPPAFPTLRLPPRPRVRWALLRQTRASREGGVFVVSGIAP